MKWNGMQYPMIVIIEQKPKQFSRFSYAYDTKWLFAVIFDP